MRLKSLISWSNNMSVGVSDIDDDHRSMIEEISLLYAFRKDHSREEIIDKVSDLLDHTSRHFDNEESYMRAMNYGKLDEHYQIHQLFMEQITQIERNLVEDPRSQLTDARLNDIARWLFNHILTEDKDYAVFAATCRATIPAE
jgi:hemerythrin-like metal-binding protein